eukprot:9192378-Ditylum_brightwellii.AAC.1
MLPAEYAEEQEHHLSDKTMLDDFIAATNRLTKVHLQYTSRAMLHGIHSVFPPPDVTGHPGGIGSRKEAGKRRRTMGVHKGNPRIDLQWKEVHHPTPIQ